MGFCVTELRLPPLKVAPMLRLSKDLQKLAIEATDGPVGEVTDLYFDDEAWGIRYLVVQTGTWFSSRKVLISPMGAGKPDWDTHKLPVSLTRDQIENAPPIDTDMPVTRQHETEYLDYYNYPYYWGGIGLWGGAAYPGLLLPGYAGYGSPAAIRAQANSIQAMAEAREQDQDPHLRSCEAVIGYHIEANDGEIGHVKGLLVDDHTWAIRYLVVSTSNWWMGHDVLVATQWIKHVSWSKQAVAIDLSREALKLAPHFDADLPLDREMEIVVHRHYGRKGYWPEDEQQAELAIPYRAEA